MTDKADLVRKVALELYMRYRQSGKGMPMADLAAGDLAANPQGIHIIREDGTVGDWWREVYRPAAEAWTQRQRAAAPMEQAGIRALPNTADPRTWDAAVMAADPRTPQTGRVFWTAEANTGFGPITRATQVAAALRDDELDHDGPTAEQLGLTVQRYAVSVPRNTLSMRACKKEAEEILAGLFD